MCLTHTRLERFAFTDPNGRPAECGLELIPSPVHDHRVIAIATELRRNPGMSITNGAEHLATLVCRQFQIAPRALTWIEWYGYASSGNPLTFRTYDLVQFSYVARALNGSNAFRSPKWRAMTDEDWARLQLPPRRDKLLFDTGQLVITANARNTLDAEDVTDSIARHVRGDWGDLCDDDRRENERALAGEGRLFSAYHDRTGTKLYVITEWDRSVTTVLLPEDY